MSARLSVDRQVCFRTGLCRAMSSELFLLREDGRPVVRKELLDDPDEIDLAESIAECCPSGAITFTEDASADRTADHPAETP